MKTRPFRFYTVFNMKTRPFRFYTVPGIWYENNALHFGTKVSPGRKASCDLPSIIPGTWYTVYVTAVPPPLQRAKNTMFQHNRYIHIVYQYNIPQALRYYSKQGSIFILSTTTVVRTSYNTTFPRDHINPFRTAVPFWGQTSQFSSSLPPKWDCSPEGVK